MFSKHVPEYLIINEYFAEKQNDYESFIYCHNDICTLFIQQSLFQSWYCI